MHKNVHFSEVGKGGRKEEKGGDQQESGGPGFSGDGRSVRGSQRPGCGRVNLKKI